MHLQDLTFNDDGNKNELINGMINFKKRSFWANVVKIIQKCQKKCYDFEKIPEIYDKLFYMAGFSDKQLDNYVSCLKKGKSSNIINQSTLRINERSKEKKFQKILILKLEEQAGVGLVKRKEVWERWVKNFQNDTRDIYSESKGLMSFSQVFFQSNAMKILFKTTLQQFLIKEEIEPFKSLLTVLFGTSEDVHLDSVINFFRICSSYNDQFDEKDKERLYLIFLSFTCKNQIFQQEGSIELNPMSEITDVEKSLKDINKMFYSLQYLNSDERKNSFKMLEEIIKEKENITDITSQRLKEVVCCKKEIRNNNLLTLEEQKNKIRTGSDIGLKDRKESLKELKEKELAILKEMSILEMKLKEVREAQKKHNVVLKKNNNEKIKEKLNSVDKDIETELLKVNEDSDNLRDVVMFMDEYCKPNKLYLSKMIFTEEKKTKLEENFENSVVELLSHLKPLIEKQLKESETLSQIPEGLEKIFSYVENILTVSELTVFKNEKNIEFLRSFKEFYGKRKNKHTSSSKEKTEATSFIENPSEEEEEEEIVFETMESHSFLIKKSDSSLNLKNFNWKPPTHIPESEEVFNSNLSIKEKNVLQRLTECLDHSSFNDAILLRILRKTRFLHSLALNCAEKYKKWYTSLQLPLSVIDYSIVEDFIQKLILYPTET